MARPRRGLAWTAGVFGGLVVLLFLLVQFMARTSFGMERARRYAGNWLAGKVTGEVSLGRISGGGLLDGVTVHDVLIRGPDGRDFVRADSLVARYDWIQLLLGRIVVDEVGLFGGAVRIERLPGDSLWNYQRIFAGDGADEPGGPRRAIRFDDVRMHATNITIGLPDDTRGRSPFATEEAGAGRMRLLRFEGVEGWLGPVVWQSPSEPGRRIRIRSLSGAAGILERTFQVTDVEGTVTQLDSITSLDLDLVELPASRFNIAGRVMSVEGGPRYDLRGEGRVDLADLAWLHPRTPAGTAELDLRLETLDDGRLSIRSERVEYRAADAEIDGAFGYVLAGTPALRGVDLRVVRADVAWLDSILPIPLNTEGSLSGRLRAEGPLSGFRTSGDLALRRPDRNAVARASWAGTLGMRPEVLARELEAELRDVDLDLLEAAWPELRLEGRIDGRVGFEGSVREGMQARAVLTHRHAAGPSVLDGVVTIAAGDSGAITSGRFVTAPLRLETLNTLHSQLAWLGGAARGAVAFDTRLDSVRVGANLTVGEGRAEIGVVADLGAARAVVDASGTLDGFAPAAIGAADFAEDVFGTFAFRLTAGDLATISGSARAELDSARIRGFPLERSSASIRFREGLLFLDSLEAQAPGLLARARGEFGLVRGLPGEVEVDVTSPSVAPLEAYFLGGIEDPTQPRMGGTLNGSGTLRGTLAAFDLDANVRISRLFVAGRAVMGLEATVAGAGVGTEDPGWRLRVRGDTLLALGTITDSLVLDIDYSAPLADVVAETWAAGDRTVKFAGIYRSADPARDAAFGIDSLTIASGTGLWSMRERARIDFGGGSAMVQGLTLEGDSGGSVIVDGRIAITDPERPGTRPLDFAFDLADVAFSTLPRQVRPIGTVSGAVNGRLRLTGTATEPVMDASFHVAELAYQGATMERVDASMRYSDQRLEGTLTGAMDQGGVRAVLSGSGYIPIDLRFGAVEERVLDRPMEFTVQLDSFPAAFAFGLVPGFTNIGGSFEGRFQATGSAREPVLSGAFALVDGAATWDATGVRYVQAEGTFLMQETLQTQIDVTARTVDRRGRDPVGGRRGTARVRGIVDLTRPSDPEFDLVLDAERMLATRRREAEIVMSGQATLGGRYRRPVVSGDLRVEGGSLYLDEIYRQYLIVGLDDPLFFDVVDTSRVSVRRVLPPTENPFLRNLLIEDTRLSVASSSWLRSREMDVEVSGDLTVEFDRLAGDLRMQGTLNALRGTYRLEYPPFARVFEVRDGQVEFPGTPGIDPSLNIEASYRARTAGGEPLDIYAIVSGTLQAPRVRLESDIEPPISESDLASYLFFGAPTSAFNFGGATSGESGVFGGLGSRALAASGLGYFASGLQTLAQSYGLVDYVGLTAAEAAGSGAREAGLGGLLASTRIELGRYLTPRLFVAYTQRLASENRGAGVRLEWRLTPTYTLEVFAEDRFARAPSFTLSQLIAARKEYGFFLFREWGY